jgi:hypothetical protein
LDSPQECATKLELVSANLLRDSWRGPPLRLSASSGSEVWWLTARWRFRLWASANLGREHPDFLDPQVSLLIAALGTQRDRYHSAGELQSYSGIAPVLATSGKQYCLRRSVCEGGTVVVDLQRWSLEVLNDPSGHVEKMSPDQGSCPCAVRNVKSRIANIPYNVVRLSAGIGTVRMCPAFPNPRARFELRPKEDNGKGGA